MKVKDAIIVGPIAIIALALVYFLLVQTPEQQQLNPQQQETEGVSKKNGGYQPLFTNEVIACPNQPNYIEPDFAPVLAYILVKTKLEGYESKNHLDVIKAETWLIVDYNVNCINIIYDKEGVVLRGAEGIFYFLNGTIYVSPEYNPRDMLPAALLLLHEMTHAANAYFPQSPYKSCVDSEVSSYLAQYLFLLVISEEDRKYLVSRLITDGLGFRDNPTITILRLMMNNIVKITKEEGLSKDFAREEQLRRAIKEYVVANPFYQKQCGL